LKALNYGPQVRAVVLRVRVVTPRKPNSARRPVVKAMATSKRHLLAHIPGIGHNLRRHSSILVRGGGARDLPCVAFSCIRGVYDASGVQQKTKRRSIYGVQLPEGLKVKLRRRFRLI